MLRCPSNLEFRTASGEVLSGMVTTMGMAILPGVITMIMIVMMGAMMEIITETVS